MLTELTGCEKGHALLDALLSVLLATLSVTAAFSAFQVSISLLAVSGPSNVLLCKEITCEPPGNLQTSLIIRCACSREQSKQSWEVIR